MLGHSIIIYSSGWDLYSTTQTSWVLDHLKNTINMVQMPLFFSVSGFCLVFTLNSKHGLSVIDKSKRLLIPFFTVGLLWMLPIRLLVRYQGYVGKSLWHIILIDIIMGKDNGHLWFLPTLMIIFLILIGVKKWVAIFKWPDWSFDLLSAFLAISVLITVNIFPEVDSIPYIGQLCRNFIYFYIGYFWHCHEEQIRPVKSVAGKISIGLLLFSLCILSWIGMPVPSCFLAVFSMLMVVCVYELIPNWSCKPVQIVSANSMGLYLFHSPLLYISFTLWPDISPYLMLTVNLVGWGLCAFAVTELLRRFRMGFVLGEFCSRTL